jgi:hypothetical protein
LLQEKSLSEVQTKVLVSESADKVRDGAIELAQSQKQLQDSKANITSLTEQINGMQEFYQ